MGRQNGQQQDLKEHNKLMKYIKEMMLIGIRLEQVEIKGLLEKQMQRQLQKGLHLSWKMKVLPHYII